AHGQGKLIETNSQRPPRQPTAQSPLARPPAQTLTRPPPSKAPLKRLSTEPTNKKLKKRGQRKRKNSEGDEDIEEDLDDKEADDVLDIDSPPTENLDREDEPLGDLLNPLPGIDIAAELWDHVADHTGGAEPNPQHLFVLVDLRQLHREIGDAQGLGSICKFLGSLTCMGVMDAQVALVGGVYANMVWWFQMQTLLLARVLRGCDIRLVQWRYNRAAGQEAASDERFGERVDMLWEPSTSDAFKPRRKFHNGEPLCLGIEKSTQFAR
ncbi:hypothetical protein L7F22_005507, partial [Adiantum nelumboides]|nr:hypothetical protein [Adiantum nelumboides]